MPPVTFVPPNTVSQHRSQRYTEDVWNIYKVDLIREYLQGGLANALRWIENQSIPKFHPTYGPSTASHNYPSTLTILRRKQLDNRLKKVWFVGTDSPNIIS